MRAEAAGDRGPWRQQAILGRGRWDADGLRDIVRDYVVETSWHGPDAVLVIDETGFLKQGKASCGVARQYTGSAGKITNCQIGVFAAYVSATGHAFIDRALYLPKSLDQPIRRGWRRRMCPQGTAFATKPALAVAMINRAIAADVPFCLGGGGCGLWCRRHRAGATSCRQGLCAGRKADHHFGSWGDKPRSPAPPTRSRSDLDPDAWQRLSSGDGTKGARLHDWAYLELADLDADEYADGPTGHVDARPVDPS